MPLNIDTDITSVTNLVIIEHSDKGQTRMIRGVLNVNVVAQKALHQDSEVFQKVGTFGAKLRFRCNPDAKSGQSVWGRAAVSDPSKRISESMETAD